MDVQYNFILESMLGLSKQDAPDFGYEMHAVSSACKPLAGWLVRDAIQECREVCAGHGYLKSNCQILLCCFYYNLIIVGFIGLICENL